MLEDNRGWTFSLEEALLWITDIYCVLARSNSIKLKHLMINFFIINTQLFTSQEVNWWTGVVWIIVMFLSAVWTLILTAPIHRVYWWASNFSKSILLYRYNRSFCEQDTISKVRGYTGYRGRDRELLQHSGRCMLIGCITKLLSISIRY